MPEKALDIFDEAFEDPRPIDDIAEILGIEMAEKIVTLYRGTRLYVPKTIMPDHELALAIGFDNAVKLSHHFQTERIEIPMRFLKRCDVYNLVLRLYSKGFKKKNIALKAGITERTVTEIVRRNRLKNEPMLPFL